MVASIAQVYNHLAEHRPNILDSWQVRYFVEKGMSLFFLFQKQRSGMKQYWDPESRDKAYSFVCKSILLAFSQREPLSNMQKQIRAVLLSTMFPMLTKNQIPDRDPEYPALL